ncbi:MAG: adenylyltransferase/cytidyltransferase family protein [Candidatus Obscuribacterales bacterium]
MTSTSSPTTSKKGSESTLSSTTTRSSKSPLASDNWYSHKLLTRDQLPAWRQALRAAGKTLATLNGSFDLLHAGHLHIIYEASLQADILLLALNTDDSIKGYKGPTRPLISLPDRLKMICALSFVDYATSFPEPNPIPLLQLLQPDVHVNGSEYGENCIEADTVRKHGGRLHIVDLVPGLSTSNLIKKIQCA